MLNWVESQSMWLTSVVGWREVATSPSIHSPFDHLDLVSVTPGHFVVFPAMTMGLKVHTWGSCHFSAGSLCSFLQFLRNSRVHLCIMTKQAWSLWWGCSLWWYWENKKWNWLVQTPIQMTFRGWGVATATMSSPADNRAGFLLWLKIEVYRFPPPPRPGRKALMPTFPIQR